MGELIDKLKGKLKQLEGDMTGDRSKQQNLPPEMPADISVAFLVDATGKTHGPTVLSSTAKDGGFDTCVQDVIRKI
jgi:hypothetical protein